VKGMGSNHSVNHFTVLSFEPFFKIMSECGQGKTLIGQVVITYKKSSLPSRKLDKLPYSFTAFIPLDKKD
jgi:hypothetical protein